MTILGKFYTDKYGGVLADLSSVKEQKPLYGGTGTFVRSIINGIKNGTYIYKYHIVVLCQDKNEICEKK